MDIEMKVPSYYQNYVRLARQKGDSLLGLLSETELEWQQLLNNVSDNKAEKAYEEGKWTMKEVIQHVTDTERVMSYRALSFSRGEEKDLPGYDHDKYARNSEANEHTLINLIGEAAVVRSSTIHLFKALSEKMLQREGRFNKSEIPISVEMIGYIIVGHQLHHQKVIREKYL